MARPLRVDVRGGWHHVMARGLERRVIFADEREHGHFLELLETMVKRYGVRVHAYVLMENHYHLLLETPQGNLSRAMQWLNVSYGVWVNRRRGRVGPLFQGRFRDVPVDGDGAWALLTSEYLHLNPVRVKGLGLDKRGRKGEGMGIAPSLELVQARLEALRGHRWSSYPAYAGYAAKPEWLTCEELWRRAQQGALSPTASYRRQVEEPLKGGVEEILSFGERLKGALAVGSESFMAKLGRLVRGDRRTQPAVRRWQRLRPFRTAMAAVEAVKGERWEAFCDRHGDCGRDVALWLGRQHCGLTLAELGKEAGGISSVAVGAAIRRVEQDRRSGNRPLQTMLQRAESRLLESET